MNRFLMFIGIGVLVLVGIILTAKAVLERQIYGKMSPEMKVQFETWYNTPIKLPEEAIAVASFSPDIVAAATDFRAEWDKHKDAATKIVSDVDPILRSGLPLDLNSDEMKAHYAKLDDLASLLEAFEALIALPDYEIDAMAAGIVPDETNQGLYPDFLSYQVTAKMMRLRAYREVSEGRPAEALASAESIIRSAKAHPYSLLITRLISIAGGQIGAHAWYNVVKRVDDPTLLRNTLTAMNELSPRPELIPHTIDLSATDQIGSLRTIKRAGIEVRMTGMTARELVAENVRAQKKYNEQFVLPNIKDEQKRVVYMARQGEQGEAMLTILAGKSPFVPRFADRLGAASLFFIAMPNFNEAMTRDTTCRVTFEVLRTETALRVAALESGATPDSLAALAPAYLPEVPMDFYIPEEMGDTRLRAASQGAVYSFGPDKIDDNAALLYDPTNGTLSRGDIYFASIK